MVSVSEAVARRMSVRAFRPDPVPGALVRQIVAAAQAAPSGGNLQPWRVYALSGAPLAELKALAATERMQETEYPVYPDNLWDPFRTRRYQCGEDLYASIAIGRDDKPGRYRQLAQNTQMFGAPVGLFFAIDRGLGLPQWADVGMFMQTIMLLAVERGLDTCAQEYWARYHETVSSFLSLPADHMVFSGMALGYRDDNHPINGWRTRRDPFELCCDMRGFEN